MSDTSAVDAAPAIPAKPSSAPPPPAKRSSFLASLSLANILAVMIVGSFIGMSFLIVFRPPDANNQFVIAFVMGLSTLSGLIINNQFGSSRGSSAKDDTIAALSNAAKPEAK